MSSRSQPSEWAVAELGEICTKPQYGYTTKAAEEGEIKFLRTTDITKGSIQWENVPYCLEPPEDLNRMFPIRQHSNTLLSS